MAVGTPIKWSLLFCCLFTLATRGGASVQCYLCSWSPYDHANRTDHCTHAHFNKDTATTTECQDGCEVFYQNDINGEFEQVRRNCAVGPPHRGCLTETNRVRTTVTCYCVTDYCNTASSSSTSCALIILSAVLAFFHVSTSHRRHG